MAMSNRIIVGNIGTVIDRADERQAREVFTEYKEQSATGYGRAAYEQVTWMKGEEIYKEFRPKLRTPPIAELARLLAALKKDIDDDYRATDDPSDDTPGMCITIGCSYDKEWSYQTGDNSYTGGAYGHPYWGVGYLYRDSNCREVAKELIEDCLNQTY